MFDQCLYFNVNRLSRSLNAVWEQAFKKTGLSPAQAYILRYVNQHPGMQQRDIAKHFDLEKSTVVRFIDALERQGLVQRERGGDDKRAVSIQPSKQGKSKARELEKVAASLYADMSELMGSNKLSSFVKQAKQIDAQIKQAE